MCDNGECGMCMGVGEVASLASTAASAASTAYSANQANSTAAGNAYMSNMTNMFMQAQNQNYNSAEAAKTRGFNSEQASWARDFNAAEALKTRNFNSAEAGIARDFNSLEAQKNRDYQERMSNTQYQRAIGDMKSAGLNPMLAYSQGGAGNVSGNAASVSGASGPSASGGAASGGQASTGGWAGATTPKFNPIDYGMIANTALDLSMKTAQVKQVDATTDKIVAETPGARSTSERLGMDVQRYRENFDLFIKGDAWDNLSKGEQNEILQIKKELDRANKNTETKEGWQANRELMQSAEQLSKEFKMRGEFLDLDEKRATSEWFKDTGNLGKLITSAGGIGQILKMFMGGRK